MTARIWLFIWRFQPVHLGHISAIEQLLERGVDRVVIGLGSSNAELSQENPFSVSEREELLRKSLDLHFSNHIIDIVQLSDLPSDEEWTNVVMETIQPTLILSGNPWTRACFAHVEVEIVEPIFDQKISATEIRVAWRDGKLDTVEQFLDRHVIEFLNKK